MFKPTIGLEIHVEMNTKSKVFSSGEVSFKANPNSLNTVYDLAFPGTLPILNKQVVINAIQVCNALKMKISNELRFDRKNYFYSDLPKGYQITQHEKPIGTDGFLEIKSEEKNETVEIERLQIEEDTAKQIHFNDFTLVDYNRCGIPLIEIVTKPCIHSSDVAVKFLKTIHEIVVFLEISEGKMEDGQLRCDVNISINDEKNGNLLGNKVEIKNVNSFSYVKEAIEYEIKRQIDILKNGKKIKQETRYYDEKNKITKAIRDKMDRLDYKYFTDCNILPITLTNDFIRKSIDSSKELASSKRKRYLEKYKLTEYDTNLLLSKKELVEYFEECAKLTDYYKDLANWINVNILFYINKKKISFSEIKLEPKNLVDLISDIKSNNISRNLGYKLFLHMIESGDDLKKAKQIMGIFSQEIDEENIRKLVLETIKENNEIVNKYLSGKKNAISFLIGQTIKKNNKINPQITGKIMLEEIKKIELC